MERPGQKIVTGREIEVASLEVVGMSTRMVEVRAKVLKQNDLLARALRERFRTEGTCVVGLVSSPGSGKTAFLEKLLGWAGARLSRSRAGRRSGHRK